MISNHNAIFSNQNDLEFSINNLLNEKKTKIYLKHLIGFIMMSRLGVK